MATEQVSIRSKSSSYVSKIFWHGRPCLAIGTYHAYRKTFGHLFEKEMQQQKNRSRAATALETEDWVMVNDLPSSKFVGYDSQETKAQVVKYRTSVTEGE